MTHSAHNRSFQSLRDESLQATDLHNTVKVRLDKKIQRLSETLLTHKLNDGAYYAAVICRTILLVGNCHNSGGYTAMFIKRSSYQSYLCIRDMDCTYH